MYTVYALVTVYNPQKSVLNNIQNLAKQTKTVFILDNSNSVSIELQGLDNTVYVSNKKNLGLSCAFNHILKEKDFSDEDYIIFFDQDSLITENYISKLVKEFNLNRVKYNLACIAPIIFDCNTKENSMSRQVTKNQNTKLIILPRLITSSLLTQYKYLRIINFWDEDIFLDWADFDLTYRFQAAGYNCGIASNIVLDHHLGDRNKKFLGKNFPYYSPIREYYQVRDALRCAFKRTTPAKEKLGMFYVATVRLVIHLLILDRKCERIKYYIKAYRDFLRHKVGECGNS